MMGKHYSGPQLEEKKELPDFIKDKVKEKHDKAHEDDDKKDDKKDSKGKKADKDYDGDGEVESSKEEYFGSKDKAIKKAQKSDRWKKLNGWLNEEITIKRLHFAVVYFALFGIIAYEVIIF